MDQQLSEFLDQYEGENPNTISKFRRYRSAHLQSLGLTIVLFTASLILHQIVGFQITELPYSQLILYLLPALSLFTWFIIYHGYQDIDMNHKRVIIYEIAKTIECYNNNEFDDVFEHIEILEDEISHSGTSVFSKDKQRKFSEYCDNLYHSDNKKNIVNESLEGIATILINDIDNEEKFEEIRDELQENSQGKFKRNVFIHAIKRFDIGLWKSLTLLVVVASFLIYNFIEQQAGFYFAVIILTIMQIWRSGGD